ncbi:MAG: hypothetical protein ABIE55_00780 [Candidatus Aenigmatarchaeota archaeon]
MVRIHDKEGRFKFRLPPNAEKVDRYYDRNEETYVTTMLDEFGFTYKILDSDNKVYGRGYNPTYRGYGRLPGEIIREDLEDTLKRWISHVRKKRSNEHKILGRIFNLLTTPSESNSMDRIRFENTETDLRKEVPNIEDYLNKSLDEIPTKDRKIIEKRLRYSF